MRFTIVATFVALCLVEAEENKGLVYDRFYASSKDFGMNVTKESVAKCFDGTIERAMELNKKYKLKLDKYVKRFVEAVEKIPEDDLRGEQYGQAMKAFFELVEKTRTKANPGEQAWFDKTFLVVSSIYNGDSQRTLASKCKKLGLSHPHLVERLVAAYELGRAHQINLHEHVEHYLEAITNFESDQTDVKKALQNIKHELLETGVQSADLKFLDAKP